MNSPHHHHEDDDHRASRRVRELYRYFQPEQPPQPTPAPSVSSYFDPWVSDNASWGAEEASVPAISTASVSTPNPMPTPSLNTAASTSQQEDGEGLVLGNPNRTLNAFAQLAALRLNVQRVLISVSDREQQFIIAESTQTSHPDAAAPEQGGVTDDGIWTGCSTVSHAWSMCKNTLAKSTVSLPPSARQPPKYRFLVVDDLSKDDRYKSLPFVQDDPHFRFYAGTPLTTETNINIGCFFVLDTRPRAGLNAAEKETMGLMGMLVMDYLKISRQAHEGRRATRLSRGLSCFVEGGSGFEDPSHPSYVGSPALRSSSPLSTNARTTNLSAGSLNSGLSRRSNSSDTRSLSSVSDSKPDQISRAGSPPAEPNSTKNRLPLDETHDTSWPFKRAANLLRQSLELGGDGGVIFLEAGNNPVLDAESGSDDAGEAGNPAPVLAVSTEEEPFAPEPGSKVNHPATNLDRSFLLRLFRQYGKGRLWGFHRDGMLSSSEDDEIDEPRQSRSRTQKPADLPKGKGKWKATENKLLNLYFPNACQVLFVPLWNAANSQWFAGCFCWNTVETRVFSPSVEMSSVLGFSSSIMAEYSRIQSLISDRQKSDFIGSISHELRSPLHGVLAAAEFLQGTQLGEFQGSLLDTINACGRTLLDTMNQVLDYSKIVSLERTWRQIKRQKASPMDVKDMSKAHLDTYVATDLGILAEEVVEGVCLGHAYGQRATAAVDQPVLLPHTTARDRAPGDQSDPNTRTEVEVTMDIGHNDWIYRTQPGALRRILMNVLGNAMKYTDFGRISVRLEVTEASEGRPRPDNEDLVTLTVTDTGKGISEEFMRARLYTPFAQEDSLAVGTGLGMSIVRSLVKALHGSVNTYSRPGEGTMVKVTLPLERPEPQDNGNQRSQNEKDTLSQACLLRDNFAGRRVAILGVDPVNAAQHPLWSIVNRYVTDWYGLELVSWPPTTPTDLVLADEQTLPADCKDGFSHQVPALIVLCNKSVDYGTAQSTWSHLAQTVEMIRQPSGPHKLARCIRKCLESISTVSETGPYKPMSISLPERPKPDSLSSRSLPFEAKQLDLSGEGVELTPELTTSSSGASSRSPGSEIEPPEPFDSAAPTASFQLPLTPSPSQKPDQEQKPSPTDITPTKTTTTTATTGESPRVLVVDDNSINLNLMLMFLKKRKLVTLDAAENGLVAVSSVEKIHGYDLIFLDMSMPVMDGFEAARAIRAMEKEYGGDSFRRATIIALTGLSSPGDESEALASGVDVFLTKPVSFKDVARLLDEWEKEDREKRMRGRSMSMSMSIGA